MQSGQQADLCDIQTMYFSKTSLTKNTWKACERCEEGQMTCIFSLTSYSRKHRDFRTQAVKAFLDLVCPHIQHDLPALQDVYGPTATDPDVQGIIFSEESRKGAVSGKSI